MPAVKSAKVPRRAVAVRMLPTDKLVPTVDNTRRPITNASVESLAKSLLRDGVLQPIVVRPHPSEDGKWEIRAGERRWRAAKLAGLAEIPAIIRPLDDQAAMTVTIAENLQRENLHPLEEAAAFQQALNKGQEPKALAAKLGKSVAFVLRRASLATLSQSWRAEVLRPESGAGRLSVAHLELIARLPQETQELLSENGFHRVFARGFPTVEELRRVIDEGLRTLASMPWKLNDEGIDPKAGACLTCPKRSGMQPALFDAEDAPTNGKLSKTDRCLDPGCFDRKMTAFVLGREAEARAKHPALRLVQLGYGPIGDSMREALGDRVTRLYDVRVVRASKPGAVPVMQVDGPKAGSVVYVDGHAPSSGNGRSAAKGVAAEHHKPPSPTDRRERLQKRRHAYLVRRIEEQLRKFTPAAAKTAALRLIGTRTPSEIAFEALALVLSFGTSSRNDREATADSWSAYDRCHATPIEERIAKALEELVPIWTRRIAGVDGHTAAAKAADAKRVCALLGIDAQAIESEASLELPEPKGWVSSKGAEQTSPLPDAAATDTPPFDADEPGTPVRLSVGQPVRPGTGSRRQRNRKSKARPGAGRR